MARQGGYAFVVWRANGGMHLSYGAPMGVRIFLWARHVTVCMRPIWLFLSGAPFDICIFRMRRSRARGRRTRTWARRSTKRPPPCCLRDSRCVVRLSISHMRLPPFMLPCALSHFPFAYAYSPVPFPVCVFPGPISCVCGWGGGHSCSALPYGRWPARRRTSCRTFCGGSTGRSSGCVPRCAWRGVA